MLRCDKELECKIKDKVRYGAGEAVAGRTAVVLPNIQCNMCSSAVVDLAAGCVGGAAAILVGQPLDTVKVKLQTSPELHQRGMVNCFRKVTNCCRSTHHRGSLSAVCHRVCALLSKLQGPAGAVFT